MPTDSKTKLNVIPEPATGRVDTKKTEVGSVFVSNYPPYSFWQEGNEELVERTLHSAPRAETPLGLYMHIPFCRKRCKFCYFRVYTDKNADEIQTYLDALATEIELYSQLPSVQGRKLKFVYFGGGTPSYIAAKHLRALVERVNKAIPWQGADEVAFECEPGTLTQSKLDAIREIGVTRLSLGVENFDDEILRENGRAHVSKEIYRVMPWIEALDFDQLNIDLIAGMVGETWESWKTTVAKTIELLPDSVTIYQMELPFNTVYSQSRLKEGQEIPVADWTLKREWQDYAFAELARAGYEISSAYTMVRGGQNINFVYRDSVWHGCDMLGTGVASFGHMHGLHLQNSASWETYLQQVAQGNLPIKRSLMTSARERLVREMILQLKLGRIHASDFQQKFGADIIDEFGDTFRQLRDDGWLNFANGTIELTRQGLLRVDQLLPNFYDTQYRHARYT